MAKKNSSNEDFVTLMIVPHGRAGKQSMQIRFPYMSRVQIVAIGFICVTVLLCMVTYSLVATYRLTSIARLLVEHRNQAEKIKDFEQQTAQLEEKLAKFNDKEASLREALGLSPSKPLENLEPGERTILRWQREKENASAAARAAIDRLNLKFFSLQSGIDNRLAAYESLIQKITEQPDRFSGLPSIWPTRGRVLSRFGYRTDPITGGHAFHAGFDISAAYGSPVHATAAGRVESAGWDGGGYGYMVRIDHGFGLSTLYGHNSKILVTEGQMVKRGEIVALAGSTGMSTGTHVHYEVQRFGRAISPANFLNMNILTASTAI